MCGCRSHTAEYATPTSRRWTIIYGITEYPFVPGHEIVGYVSHVGEAVSSIIIGDRVGIGWQGRSCMDCEWCMKGEEQLCMDIVDSATWVPYGGFSSTVVVDHRFAYPLPEVCPPKLQLY